MGMYTEFHYNVELKKNTPQNVLDVLRYMMDLSLGQPVLPLHPLFVETERWRMLFSGGSAYFPMIPSTMLEEHYGDLSLCVRTNIKNYHGEIQKFVDWMNPYVRGYEGDFLGFYRYEESEDPEIIRKQKEEPTDAN